MKWVRIDTDLYENPKIRMIASLPRGKEMVLYYILMILLCGKSGRDDALMISETKPYDVMHLAKMWRISEKKMQEILQIFEEFSLIQMRDGVIHLRGYEERQKLYRSAGNSKKSEESDEEKTVPRGGVPAGDSRAGIEQKQEQKQEQEFHSLTLTREERATWAREALGGKLGRGLVLLSEEQMADLLERLSLEEFHRYVSIVADCEAAGKSYRRKTHYRAILEMAEKDRQLL